MPGNGASESLKNAVSKRLSGKDATLFAPQGRSVYLIAFLVEAIEESVRTALCQLLATLNQKDRVENLSLCIRKRVPTTNPP
jgi:hypothetical protein